MVTEGFRGIFAGLSVTLSIAAPATALYFCAYEASKQAGLRMKWNEHTVHFVSGSPARAPRWGESCCCMRASRPVARCSTVQLHTIAGAFSELLVSVATLPFEVVKNRMQLGSNPARATGGLVSASTNYPSISAAFRTIALREVCVCVCVCGGTAFVCV
jgi:hypothetical protein